MFSNIRTAYTALHSTLSYIYIDLFRRGLIRFTLNPRTNIQFANYIPIFVCVFTANCRCRRRRRRMPLQCAYPCKFILAPKIRYF